MTERGTREGIGEHPLVRWFSQEDDIAPHEQAIEDKWKEQQGVDPETGAVWLTPRMTRNAIRTEAELRLEDAGIRTILEANA